MNSPQGSFAIEVVHEGGAFGVSIGGEILVLALKKGEEPGSVVVEVGGKPVNVKVIEASSQRVELLMDGERFFYQRPTSALSAPAQVVSELPTVDAVMAPMPGKVISAMVKVGEKVKAGDPLIILESMKMEMAVRSAVDAEVDAILVSEGQSVKRGQELVRLR